MRREVDRLARIARVMDSAFTIPGLRWRVGLDAIIGLVPGVGDLAGAVVSAWIVGRAGHLGVRRRTQARMFVDIALETVVGAVPLVGDAFDAWFRANDRNVARIRRELGLGEPDGSRR